MTTRAVRDGDDWVINGTKCWITNAGISDLYTVFARTSDDRHKGITCFLVRGRVGRPRRQARAQARHQGVAHRVSCASTTVRVPDAWRLGEVGQGFAVAMHTLDRQRPTIGAQAVGIAQGRARLRDRLHEGTQDVRPAARRQPGSAVDGRRLRDADRGGAGDGVPSVRDGRRRRSERRAGHGRGDGQVLRQRCGDAGDDRLRAVPRRLRLHHASSPWSE